jgi:malonyl-CoA/methylmalonyl-CoA synthetase
MWTCAEVFLRAQQLAARLQHLGLSPGDRVVLPLHEKIPAILAQLGVQFAGGVAVPLNPGLPPSELPYYVNDCGATFALIDPGQLSVWEALRSSTPTLQHRVVYTLEDCFDNRYHPPVLTPDAPCLIIYSSGTTGWPKGVVHTQGNLASALMALARCWRMTAEDRVLNVLPLFHVHGLCFAAMMPLLAGSCVLLEDSFDPVRVMQQLEQASVFMAVPTIYYRLLEYPDFRDRKSRFSPRLFTCGSAPIRPEVLPELTCILGKPIINRYGMSEAHVITSLPIDGPWPDGSVGVPLEGVELAVRGEDGTAATIREVGSVWIRGANLFCEYWNNPDATRAAFRDGWFETGDLGSVDEHGFLTLVGRKHDLIITHGFNVYPAMIERILNECPGVRESAVVGVPDSRKGERVVAFLVREDESLDEARVQAFCRERMTDYQRPGEIVFVDQLPRNAMGKVLKRELRDQRNSV